MISTSTSCFRENDKPLAPDEAAARIAAAGFDAVELARPQDLNKAGAQAYRDAGLQIWSVHGDLWMGVISPEPEIREAALKHEFELMERAAACAPCPYVVHYVDRFEESDITARFEEAIAQAAARAASLGFTVAVETAPYKPDQYPRYRDTAELAAFVRTFASEHVSVCMDLNHANNNEDLVTAIRNCGGLTSTIHVSDNSGTHEEHLFPGKGVIDFDAAFAALRETGYAGAVNMEVRADESPDAAWLERLALWARGMDQGLSRKSLGV